ncbi:MAG TPA: thermonuclease family protein, partial [Chitinophagaceae bacterium]|nr:thermonuclease family protein [Chitinophagaceae bacterium]
AVQCYGQAAADFTKRLIGSNNVRLESDPLSSNRDRYDRLLRYVYLPDNRLVNAEIIKQGYGFAYTSFPFTKSDEFRAYEKEAREASRGLWSSCQPMENQFGGYTSNNAQ